MQIGDQRLPSGITSTADVVAFKQFKAGVSTSTAAESASQHTSSAPRGQWFTNQNIVVRYIRVYLYHPVDTFQDTVPPYREYSYLYTCNYSVTRTIPAISTACYWSIHWLVKSQNIYPLHPPCSVSNSSVCQTNLITFYQQVPKHKRNSASGEGQTRSQRHTVR